MEQLNPGAKYSTSIDSVLIDSVYDNGVRTTFNFPVSTENRKTQKLKQ